MLEDFLGATGKSSYGNGTIDNVHSNVVVTHGSIPQHAGSLRGGDIAWSAAGSNVYFQTNFAVPGSGFNLQSYQTLDLRLDRVDDSTRNLDPSTDFTVQLVNATGSLSTALPLYQYLYRNGMVGPTSLVGPVGGPGGRHSMLQTARIPLTEFTGATLGSIACVRLDALGDLVRPHLRGATSAPPNRRSWRVRPLRASQAPPRRRRRGRSPPGPAGSRRAWARRRSHGGSPPATRWRCGRLPTGPCRSSSKTDHAFPRPQCAAHAADRRRHVHALRVSAPISSSVTFTLDRKEFDAAADGAPIRVGIRRWSVRHRVGICAIDKSRLVP